MHQKSPVETNLESNSHDFGRQTDQTIGECDAFVAIQHFQHDQHKEQKLPMEHIQHARNVRTIFNQTKRKRNKETCKCNDHNKRSSHRPVFFSNTTNKNQRSTILSIITCRHMRTFPSSTCCWHQAQVCCNEVLPSVNWWYCRGTNASIPSVGNNSSILSHILCGIEGTKKRGLVSSDAKTPPPAINKNNFKKSTKKKPFGQSNLINKVNKIKFLK